MARHGWAVRGSCGGWYAACKSFGSTDVCLPGERGKRKEEMNMMRSSRLSKIAIAVTLVLALALAGSALAAEKYKGFARGRIFDRHFLEAEVGGLRISLGAAGEHHAPVDVLHVASLVGSCGSLYLWRKRCPRTSCGANVVQRNCPR